MTSAPDREPQPTWSPTPEGLLTVDRGNTTVDCLLWNAGGERRERLAPGDRSAITGLLDALPGSGQRVLVGASVVAGGLDEIEALAAARGIAVYRAGRDLPCPLRLAYPRPETLGVDRWVSAFAARRGFDRPCVVIDCGTAVTIDLVDGDGVFRGGIIAPGAGTMAFGLNQRAPALPAADLGASLAAVPVTSADAVNAGVLHAFCGAIDRGVRALAAAAAVEEPLLVITGGDAELYRKHGGLPVRHVPDLLHRGLAELWCRAQRG